MQDTSSLFTQVVLYVFQIQKEEIMQQASYLQVLSARVSLGSLSSTGASGCIYRRYPRGDTSQGDAYTCIQGSVHQCFCMKWVLSSQNTHWRAGQCRAWCGCLHMGAQCPGVLHLHFRCFPSLALVSSTSCILSLSSMNMSQILQSISKGSRHLCGSSWIKSYQRQRAQSISVEKSSPVYSLFHSNNYQTENPCSSSEFRSSVHLQTPKTSLDPDPNPTQTLSQRLLAATQLCSGLALTTELMSCGEATTCQHRINTLQPGSRWPKSQQLASLQIPPSVVWLLSAP